MRIFVPSGSDSVVHTVWGKGASAPFSLARNYPGVKKIKFFAFPFAGLKTKIIFVPPNSNKDDNHTNHQNQNGRRDY